MAIRPLVPIRRAEASPPPSPSPSFTPRAGGTDYRQIARQIAEKYGLDPNIFERQIQQESGFNPDSVSRVGAIGLGQLMPDTAAELGVDPRDPVQNLEGSARYLAQHYKKYKRYDLALAAYNAGAGNVDKYGGIPPFQETQDYVRRILGGDPPGPTSSAATVPRKVRDLIPPAALEQTPEAGLRPKIREILDLDIPPNYPEKRAAGLGQLLAERLPRLTEQYRMDARELKRAVGEPEPPQGAPLSPGALTPRAAVAPEASATSFGRPMAPGRRGLEALTAALPSAARAPETTMAPATTLPEHLEEFAGGTAGFMATAGATTLALEAAAPFTGPAAPFVAAAAPLVGLGVAGFAPAGTVTQRSIRAGVNVTLGKFADVFSGLAQKVIPGVAGKIAGHGVGATAFGIGAPVAETGARKATGEKIEWPKLEDMARSGTELFGLNLLLGAFHGRPKAPPPTRLALPAVGTPEAGPVAPISRQLPPSTAPSGGAIITPPPTGPTPPYVAPVGRQLPAATEGQTLHIPPPPLAAAHQVISDRVAATLPPAEARTFVDLFRRAMGPRQEATTAEAARMAQGVRIIARSLTEPTPPSPEARQRSMQLTADLNQRFAGKTVRMNVGGVQTDATIVRLAFYPYPGESRPIRMIAADPKTGEVVALDFQSLGEFTGTIGGGGVSTGKGLPSRSAAMSALETQIRTRPGDRNVGKWRRRLDRLRQEAASTPQPSAETEGAPAARVAPPPAPAPRPEPPAPAAAAPAAPAAPAPKPSAEPAGGAPAKPGDVPELPDRVMTGEFKDEAQATQVATIIAKQKPGSDPKVVFHKGAWKVEVNRKAVVDPKVEADLQAARQRLQDAIDKARAEPPKPPEGGKPPEEGGAPAKPAPKPPTPPAPSSAAAPKPSKYPLYQSASKGPIRIEDMGTPHLKNAHARLAPGDVREAMAAELKARGHEPTAAPPLGREFKRAMYRGSGRPAEAPSPYGAYSEGPIFGEGSYYAHKAEDAKMYGPNVEKSDVQLSNPLVIRTDQDFAKFFGGSGNIITDAQMAIPPDREMSDAAWDMAVRKQVGLRTKEMRAKLEAAGHDGVVLEFEASGDAAKRLRESFTHDQVFALSTAAPGPAPAAGGQPVPERAPEGAAKPGEDIGARGKGDVEHPEHIDFALARALEQSGAAPKLAEMVKSGASDKEIRAALDEAFKEGGGESAIGMEYGPTGLQLTRTPPDLKGPTEIGMHEAVARVREQLGIPERSAPEHVGKFAPGTSVYTPYVGTRRAKRTFDRGKVIRSYLNEKGEPYVTVDIKRGGSKRRWRPGSKVGHSGVTPVWSDVHEMPERWLRRVPKPRPAGEREAKLAARGARLAKGKSVSQLEKELAAVEEEGKRLYEDAYAEAPGGKPNTEQQAAIDKALRMRRDAIPAMKRAVEMAREQIDKAPARDHAAFVAAGGAGVDQSQYERGPGRLARHAEQTRDTMIDIHRSEDPADKKVLLDLISDDIRIAKEYEARFSPEKIAERMKGAKDAEAEWQKIHAEAEELLPPSPADYSHGSGDFSAFGVAAIHRTIAKIFHRKVLRGIPRAQALLRRQTGGEGFKVRVQDPRGNTREHEDFQTFKDDAFSNSALHRLAARFGHGKSILETNEALAFIDARSDESSYLQDFWLRRSQGLGPDGQLFSAPYTPGARHLSRATEASPLPHSIPAHLAHIVDARRAFLDSIFDDMNDARVKVGLKPIPRHKGAYTPHNTIGAFAEAYDDIFRQLAGRPMTAREIAELKNKHLEIREGDSKYVEDSAIQDYLYMIRAARYIAYLPFFKKMGTYAQDNRDINPDRVRAVDDWMKSTFFPEKGRMEGMLEGMTRVLSMATGPKPVTKITNEVAAKRLGVSVASLKPYDVFSTPRGAKVRGTDPTAITHLGSAEGYDHYGVTKGHVVPDQEYELRGPLKGYLEGRAKFKVRLKAILAKLPGGKRAGFMDTKYHTVDELEAAAIAEVHDSVQRFGLDPVRAWTALLGRNQVRALLSGNISAVTQNSFNNVLTSYPEFGLTAVVRGMKAEAKGTAELARAHQIDLAESGGWITSADAEKLRKALKLTPSSHLAEAMGSLQGEIPRRRSEVLRRLAGAEKFYRRVLNNLDPMNPYRGVEDLTRGIDAYAAAVVAARMGLRPIEAKRIYDATQASRIALNRELSKRITDPKSAAAFVAQMYPYTMYDYGPMGQLNLHRNALGGWLGRLTTFPTNYLLNQEYRPLAGVHAVLGATVRGVARSLTGGKVGRKLPGATRTWGKPFKRAGEYPPPQSTSRFAFQRAWKTPMAKWLEEGGAGWYQRQAAKVFVGQLHILGAQMALSAATGLNFYVTGVPGYQYAMAQILSLLMPDNEKLKKTTREMGRGAIIGYARGLIPAGPLASLGIETAQRVRGIPARYKKLSADDEYAARRGLHVAQAVAEIMVPPIAEFGREITGAPVLALKRAIEVNPEFFDRVDPSHAIYKTLGIRSVYEGLTPAERMFWRQTGMLSQKRLDETRRKAVPAEDSGGRQRGMPRMPGMRGMPQMPKMSRGAA